jgi:uncharacterized protein YlxW (UPF0749 family)
MKLSRSISITVVCLILGIMLAWQYKSLYYNEKIKTTQVVRLDTLKDDLIAEKKNAEALTVRNQELLKKLEGYEKNSEIDQELRKELDRARILAGLYDVKGPGIEITLDNDTDTVIAKDILDILNELKASEAQAISVNGERIVSMSEVKKAGTYYIVINGKQMVAPFTIKAIAEPEKLENALNMLDGIVKFLEDYIKVKLEKKDSIVIPKVRDDGSVLKYNLLEPVK